MPIRSHARKLPRVRTLASRVSNKRLTARQARARVLAGAQREEYFTSRGAANTNLKGDTKSSNLPQGRAWIVMRRAQATLSPENCTALRSSTE